MRRTAGAETRFQAVIRSLTAEPGVTKERMMASDGLRVKGKFFAMLSRGRFVVKLPQARVDAIVTGGGGHRFDPGHGRLMKQWLVVTEPGADWVALAREAQEFVKDEAGRRSARSRGRPSR